MARLSGYLPTLSLAVNNRSYAIACPKNEGLHDDARFDNANLKMLAVFRRQFYEIGALSSW